MGKSTNDLEFVIDEKWKLGFIECFELDDKGNKIYQHSIGDADDWESVSMSGTTLTVKADRHGSEAPANFFKQKTGGFLHCTGCKVSADTLPEELNFAVEGMFSLTDSNNQKYENKIVVAQGHEIGKNNWWFGGQRVWGIPVGIPVAIGSFPRSDKDVDSLFADLEKKIDDIIKSFFSKLSTLNESNAEEIHAFCEQIIKQAVREITDDYAEKLSLTEEELKAFEKSLNDLIADFINVVLEILKKTAQEMKERILEWFEDKVIAMFHKFMENEQVAKVVKKILSVIHLRLVRIDGSTSKSNEFTLKVLDLFSNKAKEAQ